jgi:hypothetical protein
MVTYNVVKIDSSGSTIVHANIGYIESEDDKVTFESIHGTPFIDWVNSNPGVDLHVYFETNDPCYLIDTVNSIQDGLSLITNLENPEA